MLDRAEGALWDVHVAAEAAPSAVLQPATLRALLPLVKHLVGRTGPLTQGLGSAGWSVEAGMPN
jgi:hypothetical protein